MKHAKTKSLAIKGDAYTHPGKHFLIIIIVVICISLFITYFKDRQFLYHVDQGAMVLTHYHVKQDYLPPNRYSRPMTRLKNVNGIVIHYTANPGSSAMENRSYFENLRFTHQTSASSHFIIDQDGTILQIIPLNEIAYASNTRNKDTISIECCYNARDGHFTRATYRSLIALVKALMDHYHLNSDDVIRHYDVTGKLCPLYFVENPSAWTLFKKRLNGWSILGYLYF
jgi:N-acetylmuramoyl-L-alanine amidase CwlA